MNQDYWDFVHGNALADTSRLRLQHGSGKSESYGFDMEDAITQIEARRKSAKKIQWFNSHRTFRFPSLQASEQATNQALALFHARIVGNCRHVADLTAGLGIDVITSALSGNTAVAFEMDPLRARTLADNIKELGAPGISVICADSIQYLKDNPQLHYDWIFVDPARRDSSGSRIFKLQDSSPDIIADLEMLMSHTSDLLVKASPLLDITQTIRDIGPYPYHIRIVSYRGEVKEVLIHVYDTSTGNNKIEVVDIADAPEYPKGNVSVSYSYIVEGLQTGATRIADLADVLPGKFLYEAGAGVRKLHCTSTLCRSYPDIAALSSDTELFISDTLYPDFPGRINVIKGILTGKEAKKLQGECLRVVSSHYPLAASGLRSKLKLREGDAKSLIATGLNGGKKLLILTERY